MSKPDVMRVRQTYYLVATEIVFRTNDEDAAPCMIRQNALVLSKDGKFAVAQIARAQQAAQFQFHKRMEDPTLVVLDVVILALMPLGEFTEAEFNAKPAGVEMVEATTKDLFRSSGDGVSGDD